MTMMTRRTSPRDTEPLNQLLANQLVALRAFASLTRPPELTPALTQEINSIFLVSLLFTKELWRQIRALCPSPWHSNFSTSYLPFSSVSWCFLLLNE
jgi:hypothetical protein